MIIIMKFKLNINMNMMIMIIVIKYFIQFIEIVSEPLCLVLF